MAKKKKKNTKIAPQRAPKREIEYQKKKTTKPAPQRTPKREVEYQKKKETKKTKPSTWEVREQKKNKTHKNYNSNGRGNNDSTGKKKTTEVKRRTSTTVAPQRVPKREVEYQNNKPTYFSSGAMRDGVNPTNYTKSILGTGQDFLRDFFTGMGKVSESVIDNVANALAGMYSKNGQEDKYNRVTDFVQRDLTKEYGFGDMLSRQFSTMLPGLKTYEIANQILNGGNYENASLLGDKSDSVVQSGGQLAAQIGLQSTGISWMATAASTAYSAATEEAYQNGATWEEAQRYGLISSTAEVLSEKISGGIKLGGRTLDEGVKRLLTDKIKNNVARSFAKYGFDAVGEGVEEVVSQLGQNLGKKLSFEKDKDWEEIFLSEEARQEYVDSFIGGFILPMVTNAGRLKTSVTTGRDYDSNLSDNERRIAQKETEKRVNEEKRKKAISNEIERRTGEAKNILGDVTEEHKSKIEEDVRKEFDGGKDYTDTELSKKELNKIEDEVLEDLNLGEIDIDTIEEYYEPEKVKRLNEINRLLNKDGIIGKTENKEELLKERQKLRTEIAESLRGKLTEDYVLQETYRQYALKDEEFSLGKNETYKFENGETITLDSKKDASTRELEKSFKESGIGNTNKAHILFKVADRLQRKTGIKVKVLSDQQLKDAGLMDEGKLFNGKIVTKGDSKTLYLSTDATQSLNVVLGHEVTHTLEGTDGYSVFTDMLKEAAIKSGEYYKLKEKYSSLYDSKDLDSEMTAELAGNILFNDRGFINKMTEEPGIFKKIYDTVSSYAKATAGSKEGRQFEALKLTFEKMFSQSTNGGSIKGIAYSRSDSLESKDVSLLGNDAIVKNSVRTLPENRQTLVNNLVDAGFNKQQSEKWVNDVYGVASMILADRDRLDFEAHDNQTFVKNNQEYVKTVDASTLCAKRLLYQGTFDAISHRLPNTALTSDMILEIRQMMDEKGYEVPCGACYVESRRRHLGKFAQKWLDGYDGEYKPTLDQVTTTDGLEKLRKEHPQTYDDFIKGMNRLGSANPKVVQLRAEYKGEILKITKGQYEKINRIGGLRLQSFSDFETPHLLDMMQVVTDMATKGFVSQAYTKVPNFALVFGDTNVKINLSLMGKGKGVDENGNLIFDDKEGMDHNEAFRIRDMYSKNVGTIMVGINDEHILACMKDERIDFIIPFHSSGWGQNELKIMKMDEWKDYEKLQREKWVATGKNCDEDIDPMSYWDYSKTGTENAEIYLQKCADEGRIPVFSNFLVNNGDGTYSLQPDGSTDGYWKMLIDFKMYDNDGIGSPHEAVVPNFNMEEARRVLNEYKGDADKLPVAEDIVDEFVNKYSDISEETDARTKYSIRTEAPPKKTVTGYKVFYVKNGKLYPPMVPNPNGEATPVGVWLDADVGEQAEDSKSGRKQVKAGGKGTQGGSGKLAFRPGWHLGEIPRASQFDRLNPATGKKELFPKDFVWAECEIAADVDYQEEAMSYGYTKNGKFRHAYAGLPRLPKDGFYKYRTNPNPETVPWMISGAMKVNRLLSDEEVNAILIENGIEPVERQGGNKSLDELGLEQIENNENIQFSQRLAEDSERKALSEEQKEYFKDSKVVDSNGRLKVMYHGTANDFTIFNPMLQGGKNGIAEGYGLYFADTPEVSESYGGKLMKGYVNITNPATSYNKTIKRNDLAKLIKATCEAEAQKFVDDGDYDNIKDAIKDTWVSNYVYTYDIPMSQAYKEAAESIIGMEESDMGIVQEVMTGQGVSDYESAYQFYEILKDTLGIDGYITEWENENLSTGKAQIAVAFDSNQFKNVDNTNPTNDPDIRYSLRNLSDAEETKPLTPRQKIHKRYVDEIVNEFEANGFDFDSVLANAKNKSTFSSVDNTPQRFIEKTLGYKEGQIFNKMTMSKLGKNEADGIRWLNSITGENGLLATLYNKYHIEPASEESAAAQKYAEGWYVNEYGDYVKYGDEELAREFRDKNTQERIKGLATDPSIREFYDVTLDRINESRERNGYKPIEKRDNYYLHFMEDRSLLSRIGFPFNPNDRKAKDLPTDINGMTADNKPGQPYFASAMQRKGVRTTYDILGGIERYANSAKNQIYHIDDIQRFRAVRNYIADMFGQANGLEDLDGLTPEEQQERIRKVYNGHLSNFAKFLHEEANIIAGKTPLIDRGLEGLIGRRAISFMKSLNSQVGSNMVGLNVSSSLTNMVSVVQAISKSSKVDAIRSFTQMCLNTIVKTDDLMEQSDFWIRRQGADRFYMNPWQKAQDIAYTFMTITDNFATEFIIRTKYNEFKRKGYDNPLQKADEWAAKLLADRSLGQMPQLYNSSTLGLITKFQLEVRNQLDSMWYDTVNEANETTNNSLVKTAKITSTVVQLAVFQHLFGKAFEAVAGYNPAFDIVSVLITAFGLGDDDDDKEPSDRIEEAFLELLDDLPYTSTLTGGRIPIASALPITELIKGQNQYGQDISRLETIKETAPYWLMPTGYGQAKKTIKGLKMFDKDNPVPGRYNKSGKLQYPVDDTIMSRIQAGIFGANANKNAREYYDGGHKPLTDKQLKEYQELNIPISDYWKYRKGLSEAGDKKDDKIKYISGLNFPLEKKSIMMNNLYNKKEDTEKWYSTKPAIYSVLGDGYANAVRKINTFKADKDENGKTIIGSKKEKVIEYLDKSDFDYGEKLIIYESEGYKLDDEEHLEVINYLNEREDVSYEQMEEILKALGYKVDEEGNVWWD